MNDHIADLAATACVSLFASYGTTLAPVSVATPDATPSYCGVIG
jgi:hypothetical protein